MTAIDTAMLSAMRDAIQGLLPDSAVIYSQVSTPDGFGGVSQVWSAAGTVSCRLDVKQGREQVTGGAIQPYISTVLSVPYDTAITEANRVIHGGVTYAVVAPTNADGSWLAVKRVQLERV